MFDYAKDIQIRDPTLGGQKKKQVNPHDKWFPPGKDPIIPLLYLINYIVYLCISILYIYKYICV